ncbi:hypothetical protein F1188_06760 [Roseospira marina]|uniref:AzlD domain-containing protein n=1 Tax=Roseospira marina TaxID=140057 RepID=A0A5M6ID20_9PROT|nr:AzlD domain-containing protein [Roseospira marina]KAA5606123.1 hypothetical protein F1188_06760 [Roseospira marina]MBB4314261.1 hypothetical protein [Roseospira marina]MBB5087421.1 hypothetical protein [Roseospira marina]
MPDPAFAPWQLWAVAAGGGLGTLALRLIPVFGQNVIRGERTRAFLDRAGYGILGGIVSSSALKAGAVLTAGQGLAGAGPWIGLGCAGLALLLALWRGGTLLPTGIGLAVFVTAGLVLMG